VIGREKKRTREASDGRGEEKKDGISGKRKDIAKRGGYGGVIQNRSLMKNGKTYLQTPQNWKEGIEVEVRRQPRGTKRGWGSVSGREKPKERGSGGHKTWGRIKKKGHQEESFGLICDDRKVGKKNQCVDKFEGSRAAGIDFEKSKKKRKARQKKS